MRTIVILLIFILLSSCSIFDDNSSSPVQLERSWELVEFINEGGEEFTMYDYEVHTLRFEKKKSQLGGEAACNYYGGKYRAFKSGKIVISELAVTEALCRQPSLGEEFVDALTKVSEFNNRGGKLILFFGKKGRLIFLERLE